ncbi:class B sortase [Novisyntrophococcus fermenticellae]|uniref:class B sortase n=1 Tax=Novisyntrophococcus fermenticellae TaxID=2068655 RepID=UPI001E327D65|nr:class B sortase [Novisyntrophococcus fermenticellae]
MKKPEKKKRKGGIINTLLSLGIIICIGVFAFSAYKLFGIYRDYKAGEDEYSELQQYADSKPEKVNPEQTGEAASGETLSLESLDYVPPEVDFETLRAMNPDIVGWLVVEALDISYPIVQGRDNDEYLHRTFEKKDNFAGSIFMDYMNKPDFSDCHTIIYGHNMKNQSMFGKLKFIKEQEKYKDSRYFWIITPEHKYRYEIFSAHVTPVDGDTYTLFSAPDQQFLDYLNKMTGESQIPQSGIIPRAEDKAVTLTTCTSNDASRFVVQGIRESTW